MLTMARIARGLLLTSVLLMAGGARAADEPAAGIYKLTLLGEGQQAVWLLKLEKKEGKWSGETIWAEVDPRFDPRMEVPRVIVSDISTKGGLLRMVFKLQSRDRPVPAGAPAPFEVYPFEARLPAEGKKTLGSIDLGRTRPRSEHRAGDDRLTPVQLELTGLNNLDLYDYLKETVATGTGPEVIEAATVLLRRATSSKAKAEDVGAWASKAIKTAEPYGPRYQITTALRVAEILASQDDYVAHALPSARHAERLLTPGEERWIQQRVLTVLASILTRSGKVEEAKEVESKLSKIKND
jgi:hypothetical protein